MTPDLLRQSNRFCASTVLALSIRAFCPPVPEFDFWPAIISSSICHTAIARTVSRDAGSIAPPSRRERPQPMESHRATPCCEIGHSSRGLRVRSAGPTVAHRRISNRISNRLPRRLELAVSPFAFNRSQNSNRRKTRFLRPPWRTALFRPRLLAGPIASPDSCPCLRLSAVADDTAQPANSLRILFHPSLLCASVPPWPILLSASLPFEFGVGLTPSQSFSVSRVSGFHD